MIIVLTMPPLDTILCQLKPIRDTANYLRFELFSAHIFLFATASRPALGLTKPPIQWVSGALSPGVKGPSREAHLRLVARIRMGEALSPILHTSSYRGSYLSLREHRGIRVCPFKL
jgi:hypothetical protein